jgi:acylpyruvate hydrolase
MRLATVSHTASPEGPARTTAAVQVGDGWFALPATSVSELLRDPNWRENADSISASAGTTKAPAALSEPRFETVVPTPSKVICCGHNYTGHIVEMGRDLPEYPTLFGKYADTLCGPTDDISIAAAPDAVDWEAELTVVIGTEIHAVSEAEAGAAIAGYTVSNDVSMRDWQKRTLQWLQGKAFNATTPTGPVLVTTDEVDPVAGLRIQCRVNGETVQDGNTAELVFSCAALVSYVSQFTTLRPGDLILTGTPAGVGSGMKPPRFLSAGDVLETSIEGIGSLRNTIVA